MSVDLNWGRFYRALGTKGPRLIHGLDPAIVEWIQTIAESSDAFWSESLYELLSMGAQAGDLRRGVIDAVEEWCANVRNHLRSEEDLSESLIETLHLELDDAVIDELVQAADARLG